VPWGKTLAQKERIAKENETACEKNTLILNIQSLIKQLNINVIYVFCF